MVKAELKLKDYFTAQKGREHQPLCLQKLLAPFGLDCPSHPDTALILGLLLEDLGERFALDDQITPLIAVRAAASLGYDDADFFLEELAAMMRQTQASVRH